MDSHDDRLYTDREALLDTIDALEHALAEHASHAQDVIGNTEALVTHRRVGDRLSRNVRYAQQELELIEDRIAHSFADGKKALLNKMLEEDNDQQHR